MIPRSRSRLAYASSGRIWFRGFPPTIYGPWVYQERYAKANDWIKKEKREDGSTPPSSLYLFKEYITPILVSHRASSAIDGILYTDASSLPCTTFGTGDNFIGPGTWTLIEGTSAELTAKLLADTNPFRYEVSVPIMIAELIEAATLLKIVTSNMFTIVGSQHLNYVFGWKQMISDVKRLTSITKAIESRVNEFNSLVKKGGLRRAKRLADGSEHYEGGPSTIWSTHGININGRWQSTATSKVWGSVRWKPARGKEIDVKALTNFNSAALIAFDLQTPDYSTIWEAIPFSWLVDYFLNVGDTLQALEKTDVVKPYDICIMRHRTVTTGTFLTSQGGNDGTWIRTYQSSPGKVTQEFKLREVRDVTGIEDLLSFGIMSKGQATNLFALLLSLARLRTIGR